MGDGFGMSTFIGDLAGGFNKGAGDLRQKNQREAEIQAERDTKIFEALANSDDPEVRSAAVTGLLTGNHPARAFDKFFDKTREHPAHEQIRGLLGKGHEGLPGATEGARRTAKATAQGRDEGVFAGAASAGVSMTPTQKTDLEMGMHGAARSAKKLAKGTLYFADGTSAGGFADEFEGTFMDDDGNQRTDVTRFSPSGSVPGAGGNTGRNVTGSQAPTISEFLRQYPDMQGAIPQGTDPKSVVTFRLGADGRPTQIVVTHPPPPPPGVVPNIYQTSEGPVGIGRGGAEVPLPSSVRGAGPATRPTEKLTALRSAAASILQSIRPEPKAQGLLGIDPADMTAWQQEREEAAKRAGFTSWADLEAQIGAASRGVGEATPPPRAPGVSAAPAGPPAAPQGAAPAAGGRDPFVDSILKEIGR